MLFFFCLGNEKIVDLLIQKGLNLESRSAAGHTPIYYATILHSDKLPGNYFKMKKDLTCVGASINFSLNSLILVHS